MIGKPGPFQIIETDDINHPQQAPRRRFSCSNYDSCLALAAALNWDNFTCRGCSSEICEALQWRARQMTKKDAVVQMICKNIPEAQHIHNEDVYMGEDQVIPTMHEGLRVVGKR